MDEEQEYITLNDAAQKVGVKKGSLYYYLKALGIKTHKFPLNKHAYIATKDVKRIQEIFSIFIVVCSNARYDLMKKMEVDQLQLFLSLRPKRMISQHISQPMLSQLLMDRSSCNQICSTQDSDQLSTPVHQLVVSVELLKQEQ